MTGLERKMGIYAKVLIILIAIIVLFLATNLYKVPETHQNINGTYLCEMLPFASIVFDEEDHHAFYYYDVNASDSGTFSQETDKGTYSQKSDSLYIINSQKFHNVKIMYNNKSQSFKINLNNETYTFKQLDSNPIIIETDE